LDRSKAPGPAGRGCQCRTGRPGNQPSSRFAGTPQRSLPDVPLQGARRSLRLGPRSSRGLVQADRPVLSIRTAEPSPRDAPRGGTVNRTQGRLKAGAPFQADSNSPMSVVLPLRTSLAETPDDDGPGDSSVDTQRAGRRG